MIFPIYKLICDNCRRECSVSEDTKEDTLKYSKQEGWTERELRADCTWDLCFSCSQLTTDELN